MAVGKVIQEIVFVLLVAYHLTEAEQWPSQSFVDVITPVADKCIEKMGTNRALIDDARKGNLAETEDIKKHLFCIFETFQLIDREHHEMEYWKILSLIPKEMKKTVFEMGKGCLHIGGEDYPKASLEFIKCLHKHDPQHFAFLF